MLDAQVVAWFKTQAGDRGYQTLINETLKQAINRNDLESTLRRIIRSPAFPAISLLPRQYTSWLLNKLVM
jgi:hypothetical protein